MRERGKKKKKKKYFICFKYIRLYLYGFCSGTITLQNKTKSTPSSIYVPIVIKIQKAAKVD